MVFTSYRWANTPKPYREKGSGNMAVTHRGVQSQPLVISSGSASRHNSVAGIDSLQTSQSPKKIHWNLRKLTELPRHIIRGNLWEDADRVRNLLVLVMMLVFSVWMPDQKGKWSNFCSFSSFKSCTLSFSGSYIFLTGILVDKSRS